MNTQNIEETETTEQISDPQKAQQEVDAFLADDKYSPEDKERIIRDKMTEIDAREPSDINEAKKAILAAALLKLAPKPPVEESLTDEEITESAVAEEPAEAIETPDPHAKYNNELVIKKMDCNHSLAGEIIDINKDIKALTETTSEDQWFKILHRLRERYVGKLDYLLPDIIKKSDELKEVEQHIENNHDQAEQILYQVNNTLRDDWNTVEAVLNDANDFLNNANKNAATAVEGGGNSYNPIPQIQEKLAEGREKFESGKNTL